MLASGAELGSIGMAGIVELEGDWRLKPDHIIEIDNKSPRTGPICGACRDGARLRPFRASRFAIR